MYIKLIVIILLHSCFCVISSAQTSPIALVNETIRQIDLADESIDRAWQLAKKALTARDRKDSKQYCEDVVKLTEAAEKNAINAEKKADEAEKAFQQQGCDEAASEADDAEDYCRHLGYYTHEMLIYSLKALNEKDESYAKIYLNKALGYAEDAYESVKNAKIELEQSLNDNEGCKK